MNTTGILSTKRVMTTTSTEPGGGHPPVPPLTQPFLPASMRAGALALALTSVLPVGGCAAPAVEQSPSSGEPWSLTVWGELYEVFPEVDPLVTGETAVAHTHVTRLEDFAALDEGSVEIVLASPDEGPGEQVFRVEGPERPGVFRVEIRPDSPGEFDLAFRIASSAGREEIRGGRVRVGTAERPGGLVVAPAPKGAVDGGEPLTFLKEEQWRSDFATAWVRRGSLARSVSGLARVRPPAGGEVSVTAPVDGVVGAPSGPAGWPYPGRRVDRGASLFELVPRVAADHSLPALEAEVAALETERASASSRLARLEELLALEAVSLREVEEVRARVEVLETRQTAATRDLAAARAAREGGVDGTAGALTLRAPLRGEIASVATSPGQTVAAGEVLARLVRTDRVWLEVAVAPAGARELASAEVAGVVLTFSEGPPTRIENGLRRVSLSPEMSPSTGTVTVLLEAPASPELILGTRAEARILLVEGRPGVVVPASAVIDNGGVPVVYLQLSGERFARHEIHVLERQGDRVLVDHLVPGQRLVRSGGEAIRRSSLMGSGEAHGHVH